MWVLLRLNLLLALSCAGSSHGWAAFSPLPPTQPPFPVSPVVIANTNPATFTLHALAFDVVPGALGYNIYVSPIGDNAGQTNFTTYTATNDIPHLRYGKSYWITARAFGDGINGDMSSGFQWPQTLTNVAFLSFTFSPDMQTWSAFGPTVTVTNPAGFYRIEGPMSNNIAPYQIRE